MAGRPWTRIGDVTTPCGLQCAPGCVHGPETNVQGETSVLVEGKPACHTTHKAVGCGPPASYVQGSTSVLLNGKPVVRVMDSTNHGSLAQIGANSVIIGG